MGVRWVLEISSEPNTLHQKTHQRHRRETRLMCKKAKTESVSGKARSCTHQRIKYGPMAPGRRPSVVSVLFIPSASPFRTVDWIPVKYRRCILVVLSWSPLPCSCYGLNRCSSEEHQRLMWVVSAQAPPFIEKTIDYDNISHTKHEA